MKQYGWLAGFLLLFAASTAAQQSTQGGVGGITIIGDPELPTVLYILPWKRPELGPASAGEPPPEEVMQHVLELVDPEVLRHELDYLEHLRTIGH